MKKKIISKKKPGLLDGPLGVSEGLQNMQTEGAGLAYRIFSAFLSLLNDKKEGGRKMALSKKFTLSEKIYTLNFCWIVFEYFVSTILSMYGTVRVRRQLRWKNSCNMIYHSYDRYLTDKIFLRLRNDWEKEHIFKD